MDKNPKNAGINGKSCEKFSDAAIIVPNAPPRGNKTEKMIFQRKMTGQAAENEKNVLTSPAERILYK